MGQELPKRLDERIHSIAMDLTKLSKASSDRVILILELADAEYLPPDTMNRMLENELLGLMTELAGVLDLYQGIQ